ncbi:MAG: hypothetical protein A2Z88_07005 [Omnitrophica WOR_2 bacterium GWA2_47_8]|nr:MAG: hypothetical protein A2Z88_07005 [Omnitrophica WOR_2 bacterium GWA2_47_8]
MIGIIAVVIAAYILLLGKNRGLFEKIVVSCMIAGSYIYFLHLQGVTPIQIIEILFPFLY